MINYIILYLHETGLHFLLHFNNTVMVIVMNSLNLWVNINGLWEGSLWTSLEGYKYWININCRMSQLVVHLWVINSYYWNCLKLEVNITKCWAGSLLWCKSIKGGQSKPDAVLKQHFSKGKVVCIDENMVNTK